LSHDNGTTFDNGTFDDGTFDECAFDLSLFLLLEGKVATVVAPTIAAATGATPRGTSGLQALHTKSFSLKCMGSQMTWPHKFLAPSTKVTKFVCGSNTTLPSTTSSCRKTWHLKRMINKFACLNPTDGSITLTFRLSKDSLLMLQLDWMIPSLFT
jgi:hypothetical protein